GAVQAGRGVLPQVPGARRAGVAGAAMLIKPLTCEVKSFDNGLVTLGFKITNLALAGVVWDAPKPRGRGNAARQLQSESPRDTPASGAERERDDLGRQRSDLTQVAGQERRGRLAIGNQYRINH